MSRGKNDGDGASGKVHWWRRGPRRSVIISTCYWYSWMMIQWGGMAMIKMITEMTMVMKEPSSCTSVTMMTLLIASKMLRVRWEIGLVLCCQSFGPLLNWNYLRWESRNLTLLRPMIPWPPLDIYRYGHKTSPRRNLRGDNQIFTWPKND